MSLDKLTTTINEAGETYLDELEFSFRKLMTTTLKAVEEAEAAGADDNLSGTLTETLLANLQHRVEAKMKKVVKELGQ